MSYRVFGYSREPKNGATHVWLNTSVGRVRKPIKEARHLIARGNAFKSDQSEIDQRVRRARRYHWWQRLVDWIKKR